MPKLPGTPTRKVVSVHKLYDPRVRKGANTSTIALLECGHAFKSYGKSMEKLRERNAAPGQEHECRLCPVVEKPKLVPAPKTVKSDDNTERVLVLLERVVAENAKLKRDMERLRPLWEGEPAQPSLKPTIITSEH